MFRIHRYVFRQVLNPLLVTLGIAALLLLLERMLRIFDFVINEGGPFSVVWRMLGTLAPHYLSLALPIGLFLGVQLGFRKLSQNSELDALQSSGIGLNRLMLPLISLALILVVISIALNGFIQPYGRYAYANLAFEVRSGTLGASIRAGEFTNIGKGTTLRVESARDGGRVMEHIFIEKETAAGRTSTITARQGSFFSTDDLTSLVLRLEDGVLIDLDLQQVQPRVLTFDTHDFIIDLPDAGDFRDRGDRTAERTLPELARIMHTDHPDANEAEAAFHARLIRGFTLLILPFFALPLGIAVKRAPGSFGITFGILVMLIHHKALEFGEAYAGMGGASVWLMLWVPTALFVALSLRFYYIAAYRVGGAPLRPLEDAWTRTAAYIGTTLRRKPA